MSLYDFKRKGMIFLWRMYDGTKSWNEFKGKIYGPLPDCVRTDLKREFRSLYGADFSVPYHVMQYPDGCYSVLVRVKKDSKVDGFLRMKGFVEF